MYMALYVSFFKGCTARKPAIGAKTSRRTLALADSRLFAASSFDCPAPTCISLYATLYIHLIHVESYETKRSRRGLDSVNLSLWTSAPT